MPTLEELLNLKDQSLSSFLPKKDDEETIVSDALASPVRPEFLNFLEKYKKEKSQRPEGTRSLLGSSSPEELAIKDLNEYDTLKTLSSAQKSTFDDSRLADLAKSAQPVAENKVSSIPFYPTPTGAPVADDFLKISQAAPLPQTLVSRASLKKPTATSEESALAGLLKTQDSEQSQYADLLNRFKDAQNRQRDLQQNLALAQAAETIGSSIAMVKPEDQSFYDQMYRQAGRITDEFKEEAGVAREAEKNNPNSAESRSMRALLKEQGITIPENISAAFIEKQYPQFANIINRREAAQARKEELKLRFAEIAGRKDEAKEEKQDKFVQALRKETTSGALGKMFGNYNTAKRMEKALSEFSKSPGAYSDYATLMGGLKALQGDDSVVREAEVRLGMSATSLANKVKNWSDRLVSGRSLQPSQRDEMVKTVKTLSETARNQYSEAISPIINQAKKIGISTDLLVGEGILEPSKSSQSEDKIVVEKDGKQFRLPKAQLQRAISQGYKEVK